MRMLVRTAGATIAVIVVVRIVVVVRLEVRAIWYHGLVKRVMLLIELKWRLGHLW